MNSIGDVMKGSISGILIAFGYILLLCGIFCLIWSATGTSAGTTFSPFGCGMGCAVAAAILMGSGIGWYYIVKPKA